MSDSRNTWMIKTFEDDGSTKVRQGVSPEEAVAEIYRMMRGGTAPRKPAVPVKPTETVEFRPAAQRQTVAA